MKEAKKIIRKNLAGLINKDFLKKFPNYHAGGLVFFDDDGNPSTRRLNDFVKKKYGGISDGISDSELPKTTQEFIAKSNKCRENLFEKFREYHRSDEARKGISKVQYYWRNKETNELEGMDGFDAESWQNISDAESWQNVGGVDGLRTEYFNSSEVPGVSGLSKIIPSRSTTSSGVVNSESTGSSGVLNSEAMECSKILESNDIKVIKLDLWCERTTDLILVQDHAFLQDVMALGMGVIGIGVLTLYFIFSEK